jgi:hypothetical protein
MFLCMGVAARRHQGGVTVSAKHRSAAILLGIGLGAIARIASSQEDAASDFVKLSYSVECDAQNRRLMLTNAHTYKTLQVVVRWRAAGGKDLQDQFFPAPSTSIEIGCAADAQIIEVQFANF